MKYKVLMIDDEYGNEANKDFVDLAKFSNVEIKGVRFHKEGMDLLKNDVLEEYQAVILDVTGYFDKEEDNLNRNGLKYSLKELDKLRNNRLIPWFIFTGVAKNIEDKEFESEIKEVYQTDIKFGRDTHTIYIKAKDEGALLDDIVSAIENQKSNETLYKYRDQLKTLKQLGATDDIITDFKNILQSISILNNDLTEESYFTSLRKIVEWIFRGLKKKKIIPPDFIPDDKVNLIETSKFLAGKEAQHIGYKSNKPIFNEGLAKNVANLIHFVNSATHTSEKGSDNKIDYSAYKKDIDSPYLLYLLSFITLDLLIWYKNYTDKNHYEEVNKSFWKKISSVELIIQFDDTNYFADNYLFNKNYVENNQHLGKKVRILEESENTDYATKHMYKKFVKRYEIVDE